MRISHLLSDAKEIERTALLKSMQAVLAHNHSSTDLLKSCQQMVESRSSPKKKLRDLFSTLRMHYTSRAYTSVKNNEQHPEVCLAHALTICLFTETSNWDSLIKVTQPQDQRVAQGAGQGNLAEKLREVRKKLVGFGAHEKDRSLRYMVRHPNIFLRAFRSHPLGHMLFGWFYPYDPRMAENYPCLLFEEKKEGNSILFSITPTPTVGLETSLETQALLQALLNRQNSDIACLRPNLKAWIYVNLQSLQHDIETKRSKSIMTLNERYPGMFYGITIDVNSDFYKYYEEGSFGAGFVRLIENWLLDKGNYSLNTTTGHFFPIPEWERNGWESALQALLQNAVEYIRTGSEREKIRALKELMLLALIRLWQGRVYGLLSKSGQPFEVLSTVACKECIDRGGKLNAALVWALDPSPEPEKEMKVIALFYGRALLARNRMIQKRRSDAFFDLISVAPLEQVENFCNLAFSKGISLGTQQSSLYNTN